MKICCGTGRGFAVIRGLVGRAICFNEKVIPGERKRVWLQAVCAWLKFLLCNKSTRTCVSTCVCSVWVYRRTWNKGDKVGGQVSRYVSHTHKVLDRVYMHTSVSHQNWQKYLWSTTNTQRGVCAIFSTVLKVVPMDVQMTNRHNIQPTHTILFLFLLLSIHVSTEALLFVFFFQILVDPDGGGWSGPMKRPFSPYSLMTLNLLCTSRKAVIRKTLTSLPHLPHPPFMRP